MVAETPLCLGVVRDVDRLVKVILSRTMRQYGLHIEPCLMDDLYQEMRLAVFLRIKKNPTVLPWKAARGAAINYLRKWWREADQDRLLARRRYYDKIKVCSRVEYLDLRAKVLEVLESGEDRLQGVKDGIVFCMWLDGEDVKDICQRCPWFSSPSCVEAALVRIINKIRDAFGTESGLPIILRLDSRRRTDETEGYRSTAEVKEYNRQYYLDHREERIKAVSEARRRRNKLASVRDLIHAALLAHGYKRYGLANSGASGYYVHSDGYRVRVSDHKPRSRETERLVEDGEMYLLAIHPDTDSDEAVTAIETARTSRI